MLINPFTPSEIAREPGEFFGRGDELGTLERSLLVGSVVIQGPVGIGKSSLLKRCLLRMEGFDSDYRSKSVVVVGHKDIESVEDAALLLLTELVRIDEKRGEVVFRVGNRCRKESVDICRNFAEGRYLAALKKVVGQEYADLAFGGQELLLLAIDEADKCAVAITRLIRGVVTHVQHHGASRVRFLLAGVNPFLKEMIGEDPGMTRFFSLKINVQPMFRGEATQLLRHKFERVRREAHNNGLEIAIDPKIVVPSMVELSGAHPSLMQLLGSRLIECENSAPDGSIDSRDLHKSLCRICLDDRGWLYDAAADLLAARGCLDAFRKMLESLSKFPALIDRAELCRYLGEDDLEWLVDHDFLAHCAPGYYRLVDEFLRVRLVFF